MPSKTRQQRQKKKANVGKPPAPIKSRKSVHEKKVRPNMPHKQKIRLGMTSLDIYEGFEDKKGVNWVCPKCSTTCHVVGFCIKCSAEAHVSGKVAVVAPVSKAAKAKKAPAAESGKAGKKSTKK
jgi:hypothetical protein